MSRENAARLAREANRVLDDARREGREPSVHERTFVQELLDRAKSEAGLSTPHITGADSLMSDPRARFVPLTPGAAFTSSSQYKAVTSGRRGERWSTGPVEVSIKGTLTESAVAGGAGLIPTPQVIPGYVDKLLPPASPRVASSPNPRLATQPPTSPSRRWRPSSLRPTSSSMMSRPFSRSSTRSSC
jgi:hypothetical protein